MSNSFRLSAATGLHKGDRPYQQDQVLVLAHPRVKGCVLAVVADGMGGRSGGRAASDQVMMTARQVFESFSPEVDNPEEMLNNIVRESHLLIRLVAIAAEQEPHSTIAAYVVMPNGSCMWVHAGDSRIYHFRNGQLLFQTSDHSYVQTLVDQGELTLEEARYHPQSNILLNCLGTAEDPPLTHHRIPILKQGDVLMACSDGIWHYFTPDELSSITRLLSAREASQFLIERAGMRGTGTGDNMSLAIIKIEPIPTDKPENSKSSSSSSAKRSKSRAADAQNAESSGL
ncbi:MAG: protein phosphatase 2C domain-containing protein [Comamonas sp.]